MSNFNEDEQYASTQQNDDNQRYKAAHARLQTTLTTAAAHVRRRSQQMDNLVNEHERRERSLAANKLKVVAQNGSVYRVLSPDVEDYHRQLSHSEEAKIPTLKFKLSNPVT